MLDAEFSLLYNVSPSTEQRPTPVTVEMAKLRGES